MFFAFLGKVDTGLVAAPQPITVGLGLITYDGVCLTKEKVRLFGGFEWGVPVADTQPVVESTAETTVTTEPPETTDSVVPA